MAYTPHYHLTLFESADKPTWLNDWNNTIAAIDTALYNISSGGGELPDLTEVVTRLQALEGRVDSDELRLNQIEGYISTMQDDIAAVQASITSLSEELSATNANVTNVADDLSTLSGSVDTLASTVSGLSTRVTDAEGNITSLDGRVTALEGASGGLDFVHIHGSANSLASHNYPYPLTMNDVNNQPVTINDFSELIAFFETFKLILLTYASSPSNRSIYTTTAPEIIQPSTLSVYMPTVSINSNRFKFDTNGLTQNGSSSQTNYYNIYGLK